MLQVVGNTVLDDDAAVEETFLLASLDEVLDALGEASEMFVATLRNVDHVPDGSCKKCLMVWDMLIMS